MGKLSGDLQKISAAKSGVDANSNALKELLRRGVENCELDSLGRHAVGKGSIAAPNVICAKELPEQFNLTNYNICTKWTLKDWVKALVSRWRLRLDWQEAMLISNAKPNEFQSSRVNLKSEIFRIIEDPAYSIGEISTLYRNGSPIADQTVFRYFFSTQNAEDPNYEVWYERFQNALLNWPERSALDEDSTIAKSPSEPADTWPLVYTTPSWKMQKEVGDFYGHYAISVNLGASDDRLLEEFRAWVKRTRKESGQRILPKRFDRSKFDDWHQSRLLPYLDLKLWTEVHGFRMTNDEIGKALFPVSRGDDGAELGSADNIRRTIQRNRPVLTVFSSGCR